MQVCKTCSPPVPKAGDDGQAGCTVATPNLYYVSSYGPVSGISQMKAQIYMHGPIGCGIQATDKFEAYTDGIYEEWIMWPAINHEIAVVGWGQAEDGTEFWWGRNSWGTYWGQNGFFQIKMGENNLGIETNCDWGIPSLTKPTSD
jgi:cathepsin X